MDLKIYQMYFNSIWELIDQLDVVKRIGCKWIYKRKRDQAGKVKLLRQDCSKGVITKERGCTTKKKIFLLVATPKSIRIYFYPLPLSMIMKFEKLMSRQLC